MKGLVLGDGEGGGGVCVCMWEGVQKQVQRQIDRQDVGQVDRDSKVFRKIGKKNRRERGSRGQFVYFDISGLYRRYIY